MEYAACRNPIYSTTDLVTGKRTWRYDFASVMRDGNCGRSGKGWEPKDGVVVVYECTPVRPYRSLWQRLFGRRGEAA